METHKLSVLDIQHLTYWTLALNITVNLLFIIPFRLLPFQVLEKGCSWKCYLVCWMEWTISTTVWHWEALRERMRAESETSTHISIELHVWLQICYTNSFEEQEQNKFRTYVHIMSAITLNLPYYPLTLCVLNPESVLDPVCLLHVFLYRYVCTTTSRTDWESHLYNFLHDNSVKCDDELKHKQVGWFPDLFIIL